MTRTKDLPVITSEAFGDPGKNMIVNRVLVTTDSTASGSLTLYYSKDLSTFTTHNTRTISSNGTVEFQSLGMCREIILRLGITSDSGVDLVDVAVDAEILKN